MFKRWIERIKNGCRDFVGAMTRKPGLRKMTGYHTYWMPVATVPEEFRNRKIIETDKCPKFRYQQWEQTRCGRWRSVWNFIEMQSHMNTENF